MQSIKPINKIYCPASVYDAPELLPQISSSPQADELTIWGNIVVLDYIQLKKKWQAAVDCLHKYSSAQDS